MQHYQTVMFARKWLSANGSVFTVAEYVNTVLRKLSPTFYDLNNLVWFQRAFRFG